MKERVAEFSESIEKYSFYKDDSKYIDKLNAYKKVLAEFTTDKSIWAKTHIERKKKDIELNNERIEGWKKDIESYKKKLVEVEKAPADSRFKFPKEKTLHTKQYTIKYYKELIDRCNSDIKECEERNAKFKKDIQTAEVLIDKKTNTKKQRNDKRTKKQALIDHIKHLTNIDLSEYVDDESPKRKYLNIVWNKIPENDQNTIRRIAHQYGKFTLEQNGYSRMALFYGDKLNTDEKPHLTKSIVWLQNYLSKSGQKKESAIEVLRKRLEKERRA